MPNLEELIKIREEAIKKHIDANDLERFLFARKELTSE